MIDYALRPVTDGDRDFLLVLHATTRMDLDILPPDLRDQMRVMQFNAKTSYYHQVYGFDGWMMVEVDGQPVGSIHTSEDIPDPGDIRLVDMALLPQWRGRGIGGALLCELQKRATAVGKSVSLHVELGSPARRLYDRMGWQPGAVIQHFNQRMDWWPNARPLQDADRVAVSDDRV